MSFRPTTIYVAVRPDNTVCGPIGKTKEFVQKSLCIGHERVGMSGKWEDIAKLGYRIERAEIHPIIDPRKEGGTTQNNNEEECGARESPKYQKESDPNIGGREPSCTPPVQEGNKKEGDNV